MKSPWHRDTSSASHTLRLHGLLAAVPTEGRPRERALQARWTPAPPVRDARSRPRASRSSWTPRIVGLLAFCALALGVLVAGSDTCAANEAGRAGNYSRSTLAPLTDADAAAAPVGMRGGHCKRKHDKASRFGGMKKAP